MPRKQEESHAHGEQGARLGAGAVPKPTSPGETQIQKMHRRGRHGEKTQGRCTNHTASWEQPTLPTAEPARSLSRARAGEREADSMPLEKREFGQGSWGSPC